MNRYGYLEVLEFDIVVVLLVALVMPGGLWLASRARTSPMRRLVAFVLVLVGVLYVGIFEHYRMHRPRITQQGLQRTVGELLPVSAVAWWDETFSAVPALQFLNLDGVELSSQSISVLQNLRDNKTHEEVEDAAPAPAPVSPNLLIHFGHPNTGLVFFKHLFRVFAADTCSDTNRLQCLDWDSGSGDEVFPTDATLLQVENPMPPVLNFLNQRPFRGIFTVRDPRDLVVATYFRDRNAKEPWAHMPRKEYGGKSIHQELHRLKKEEGINVEIERLNAVIHQEGIAGSYARSAMSFAALAHPNVTFLKYEELVKHANTQSPVACAVIGQWFQLNALQLAQFVEKCLQAYDALALHISDDKATGGGACRMDSCPSESPISMGMWQRHFTSGNVEYFNRMHSNLLKTLGYDKDYLSVPSYSYNSFFP